MTGIERLRDIAYDGPYSGGMIHISVQRLREICEQIEREVGVETVKADAMEALAFVEEHGGLDAVRMSCGHADNRRVELCSALGIDLDTGWSDAMERMRLRIMPEGMEWPRFETGEPVHPGDRMLDKGGDWFKAVSFVFTLDWWSVRGYQTEGFGDLNDETRRKLEGMAYGTCVKRPAPKALDADGVEIRVGDTVWDEHGDELVVLAVYGQDVHCRYAEYEDQICDNGTWEPLQLTHERPDSWEKVWSDVYQGRTGSREMACRCMALAERGQR